ncbi:hypothetical protein V2J09_016973 [Rumex salicifolius]
MKSLFLMLVKTKLQAAFTIKDLGLVRIAKGILVNQRKYASDLVTDTQLSDCKATPFPLPRGLGLAVDQGELLVDPESYRCLIGRQFLSAPCEPHYKVALYIIKYLKGTVDLGLFFHSNNFVSLTTFCILRLIHVKTSLQIADVMTKPLGEVQH